MAGVASRTPAQDKVRPYIAVALAEGWTVTKLAKTAKVSRNVAGDVLKDASRRSQQDLDSQLSQQTNRALRVARRSRDAQIEQAGRMDALSERAISDLEAKAKAGELSIRDLETLTRLRERHWLHLKDMAGISAAEKIAIGQAKGEAQGRGLGSALIDSTAIDVSAQVWESDDDGN